ncbi:MAG TPA: phosphohistidine phosphatase SixA [Polyangiaceae bacterium]|nr:phosphohistidine phosphatase SixA [Polyangiaceae bacterium]
MKLYVMRHGPAEEEADSGVDGDRALTAVGRRRVRNVAKALLEAGEQPIHVFTSSLVRAVQTAEIVAVVTNLSDHDDGGTVRVRRELAPGGAGAQLAQRLASEGLRRVMVVGHEPDLSDFVSTLCGAAFGRPFEKAMVVGLQLASGGRDAALRFVLDPKTLRVDCT